MNLVHDYEFVMKFAIFLFDRLNDTDKSTKDKSVKRLDMKKFFAFIVVFRKFFSIEQFIAAFEKFFAINQFSTSTSSQRFVVVVRKSFTTKTSSFVDADLASSEFTSSISSVTDSMILRFARLLKR